MFGHRASLHLTPGIICSLQAGLLAQQDSFAPFIWVAVQSVLNVVGDLVLIMYFKQGLVRRFSLLKCDFKTACLMQHGRCFAA